MYAENPNKSAVKLPKLKKDFNMAVKNKQYCKFIKAFKFIFQLL